MYPRLFEIPLGPLGHLPVNSYGLMVMLGFLAAIFVASQRSKQENISPETILDLGIITMLTGIIGARIAYLVIYGQYFHWQIFNIFDGNLNIFGLVIGWFIPLAIFYLHTFSRRREERGDRRGLAQKPQARIVRPKKTPVIITFIGLFVLSFISAIIVGRIVYLILHRQDYTWAVFKIWEGGLIFYGGLILGIIGGAIYLKKKQLNILQVADLIAPVIALGLALGRIGCFLNGCCYGKIAQNLPWAVRFPKITSGAGSLIGSPPFIKHLEERLITQQATYSLPVHPIQLYESIFALILFVILSIIWKKNKSAQGGSASLERSTSGGRNGIVIGLLVLFYSIWRFLIEFIRGDWERILWGLTICQLVSLGTILLSIIFLLMLTKTTKQTS